MRITNPVASFLSVISVVLISACESKPKISENAIKPKITTVAAKHDTDDAAIWINEEDPSLTMWILKRLN